MRDQSGRGLWEQPYAPQAALVIDHLRGGTSALLEDRDVARDIEEAVPDARRLVTWTDRFHAHAAALAFNARTAPAQHDSRRGCAE